MNLTPGRESSDSTQVSSSESVEREKDIGPEVQAERETRNLTNQYPSVTSGLVAHLARTAFTAIATSPLVEALAGQMGGSLREPTSAGGVLSTPPSVPPSPPGTPTETNSVNAIECDPEYMYHEEPIPGTRGVQWTDKSSFGPYYACREDNCPCPASWNGQKDEACCRVCRSTGNCKAEQPPSRRRTNTTTDRATQLLLEFYRPPRSPTAGNTAQLLPRRGGHKTPTIPRLRAAPPRKRHSETREQLP